MSTHGGAAEDAAFVRTYTLTRGRTQPRHLLALDTVLDTGPGRPGPGQAEECAEILALCREHRRSVTELAGQLGRPVTAVKILVSDLLDADALVVPVSAAYAASGTGAEARPSPQLLAALSAGLKRKWPNAIAYPQAG
ncbi:DUF742 domain-containing protein [Streptomyces sp. NPDC055243]|uniref:DUF742 domain-containing protein n=1 Tax=Streptomyces sp. NPDC055243 TaxID=3365720 RepID=UPI0037CD5880